MCIRDRGAPALQRALKHEVPGPLSIRAHAEDLLPSRLYCRSRNFTESALRLADFTAGRESHPALKMLCSCSTGRILRPFFPIVNYPNYFKWVKAQNPMATSSPEPTRPAGSASRPAPVSYTHLDVYKRQAVAQRWSRGLIIPWFSVRIRAALPKTDMRLSDISGGRICYTTLSFKRGELLCD